MNKNIKEILKINSYIDQKLYEMNSENRAVKCLDMIKHVRDLNDHTAMLIYKDLFPSQEAGINNVAKKFISVKSYRFIAKFHKFLNYSISHFTPTEDGAERLMIKYYDYLIQLKQVLFQRYKIEVLVNINNFLEDLDKKTSEYYHKVAERIEILKGFQIKDQKGIYYIYKYKPFIVNRKIYYEVTLELANDKTNKFNRITAFTDLKIDTFYATELNIIKSKINIFDTNFPIFIITNWDVSIRPCELINFSRILSVDLKMQRNYNEYKSLMYLLKDEDLNLVDIVSLSDQMFNELKHKVESNTRNNNSPFFDVLEKCKEIISNNESGSNILRYLLFRMNNKIIKDQWPYPGGREAPNLYLSTKCKPFEDNPFSFDPKDHVANYHDIMCSIGSEGRQADILARYIRNNTDNNGRLYTSFDELSIFGNKEEVKQLIDKYNDNLYGKFFPNCALAVYDKYVYRFGYELTTFNIVNRLKKLTQEPSTKSIYFNPTEVENLKSLGDSERLDDLYKEDILKEMFSKSRVHLIYGAAGTGKTTLVNHITRLMRNCKKVFLAKTNAAVINLQQKVNNLDNLNEFMTIDKFFKKGACMSDYDMIVVDECSTVKNEEILGILENLKNGVLVLIGDIYQIEAIGYGNWFNIVKDIMPKYCCHELTKPYRTTDEGLKKLWDSVRNMDDDNLIVEELVRNDFSLPLSDNIIKKYDEDEIVLCLNYNGLYGLNNINKLMQLGNPNKPVEIGILEYKIGDPILFNDSNRFSVLYNNLKGKIVNLIDNGDEVEFHIEVGIKFGIDFGTLCEGLTVISTTKTTSIISFIVKRHPTYFFDEDNSNKEYIMPFQVAYAVSIHKSQGLEYNSVKIVIADDSENMITHNIFYTAITRARNKLMIYWSPEVCNRILKKIRPIKNNRDFNILLSKINESK